MVIALHLQASPERNVGEIDLDPEVQVQGSVLSLMSHRAFSQSYCFTKLVPLDSYAHLLSRVRLFANPTDSSLPGSSVHGIL